MRTWALTSSPLQRTMRLGLLAVCGTAIFSTALVQMMVVLLTTIVVISKFTKSQRRLHWTSLHVPFALFVAGRVLSIAFSQDFSRSATALFIEYFYYLLFFAAAEIVADEPIDAAGDITHVLVWSGTVAAALGSALMLLSVAPRALSTTAGTYTLGGFLCLVLPLALFFPHPLTRKSRLIRWTQVLIICMGIVLTLDRLHWVAMAAIIVVAGVMSHRRLLVVALAVSVFLVMLFPSVHLRLQHLYHLGSFMTGRDVLWKGAAMLLDRHPLVGFGPRTFQEIFPLFSEMPIRGVGSWHNDYLQVYMESGLLGLVPLLWLLASSIKQGWRAFRRTDPHWDTHRAIVAVGISLGVIAIAGGMLDTIIGIPFRILLGVFAQLTATILGTGKRSSSGNRGDTDTAKAIVREAQA
ncbi:MAG TPA: O-antigen ligase family protein [Bacteroidota bacterium]|nr:O-antigen ligase family protein [Bacteroidota bacterium]